MMDYSFMGGGWPFGGLLGLAILALAVYGLLQLVRLRGANAEQNAANQPGALKTLDERYARSEIERDEYLRRKQDILGKGQA
jgi:putative membrane protein